MTRAVRSAFGPARATLRTSDALRRWQGRAFDLVGLGPRRAPSTVLLTTPMFRLRSYEPLARPATPVLIVAAPIKRAYIWDMAPEVSPIRLLTDAGFAVHLLEWLDPRPSHSDAGLDTYVERSVAGAVDVVRSAWDAAPVLVGHSLGGTLSALFCARHPRRVAGTVLLEAPLHFGANAGAFAPVVAASPNARWLQAGFGLVPGSFLDVVTTAAAPRELVLERYADFWTSWGRGDLRLHLQVLRWAMDESALPGRLVAEIVEDLYRNDRFMRGDLVIGGSGVGPATLTVPMLNVVDPHDGAIPASSIVPFHRAAASPRKELLEYHADHGVALRHVGVLVGHGARTVLWPRIIDWIDRLN